MEQKDDIFVAAQTKFRAHIRAEREKLEQDALEAEEILLSAFRERIVEGLSPSLELDLMRALGSETGVSINDTGQAVVELSPRAFRLLDDARKSGVLGSGIFHPSGEVMKTWLLPEADNLLLRIESANRFIEVTDDIRLADL